MNRISSCLLGVLLMASVAQAAEAPDADQLKMLLHEFMTGASNDDLAAHDRFWSDDLVYTSSTGDRYGKQEIIQSLVDAQNEGDDGPDVTYLAENVDVRQYGDAAVITFRLIGVTHNADGSGRPTVENYFNTGTLVREEGEWRVVAWQATRIPEE